MKTDSANTLAADSLEETAEVWNGPIASRTAKRAKEWEELIECQPPRIFGEPVPFITGFVIMG